MGEGDSPDPDEPGHSLEPARSLFADRAFANVSGPYIAIYLELACRGPLTSNELAASDALVDVSRSRVYELLREMRSEGVVTRMFATNGSAPSKPRYQLVEKS
jgi:predicted transcriptional regulator